MFPLNFAKQNTATCSSKIKEAKMYNISNAFRPAHFPIDIPQISADESGLGY